MLLSSGLVYALFVTVQATTSALLQSAYPFLTQTDVGLCFLPMGISSMLASFFTGRFLDWQYRRDRAKWTTERKRIRREQGGDKVDVDAPWTKEEELTFHIELARVKWGMAYTLVAVASAFGYGWALDKRVHLSVPMILQFLSEFIPQPGLPPITYSLFGKDTYATVGQMNCFQTLLLDAFPGSGSSMTAIVSTHSERVTVPPQMLTGNMLRIILFDVCSEQGSPRSSISLTMPSGLAGRTCSSGPFVAFSLPCPPSSSSGWVQNGDQRGLLARSSGRLDDRKRPLLNTE